MDKIVYLVVTKPSQLISGSAEDNGGKVLHAFCNKHEAEAVVDEYTRISPIVVDFEVAKEEALAKLSPIDKLVLGHVPSGGALRTGGRRTEAGDNWIKKDAQRREEWAAGHVTVEGGPRRDGPLGEDYRSGLPPLSEKDPGMS